MSKFKVGDKVEVRSFTTGEFFGITIITSIDTSSEFGGEYYVDESKLNDLFHKVQKEESSHGDPWCDDCLKLVEEDTSEDTSNYHPNYEAIVAWLKGEEVEWLDNCGDWHTYAHWTSLLVFQFHSNLEMRIKPPKSKEQFEKEERIERLKFEIESAQKELDELENS